ncbi:hypothetical protein K435DRAFT_850785 [Dendrothele bispora CBS 962.96]|uniref:Uncharacterized protein n=1 Tax=Dendrothele bispora (strain CBS 962.96) TaxID=1314807 RepID=A0A4S8MNJ7_DENBC|nr:hypothetical protein K435DRAFT_850785 [Dendrothele bispora CBS 962.96]
MSASTCKLCSHSKADVDTQGVSPIATDNTNISSSLSSGPITSSVSTDVVMSEPLSAAGNSNKEITLGDQEACESSQLGNSPMTEPVVGSGTQNTIQGNLEFICTFSPYGNNSNTINHSLSNGKLDYCKRNIDTTSLWARVTRKNKTSHSRDGSNASTSSQQSGDVVKAKANTGINKKMQRLVKLTEKELTNEEYDLIRKAGLHPEISFWDEVVEAAEVIELAEEGAQTEHNNLTCQCYTMQQNNNWHTDKAKEKNKWNNISRTKHKPRDQGPVTLKEEVREFLGNVQPKWPRKKFRPLQKKFQPFKTASMHVDVQETERLQSLADTTASTGNIELEIMSWDSCQADSSFDFESLPDLQEVSESDLDLMSDLQSVSDSKRSDIDLNDSNGYNSDLHNSSHYYTSKRQNDDDTDPEMPDFQSVGDSDAGSSYGGTYDDTYQEENEGHFPFPDQ